jgi:hypothetical protein
MVWLAEMTLLLRERTKGKKMKEIREDVMTKDSDNIKHPENGQPDAVTMGLASYTTIFQAIVAEGTDYTKKAVETRLAPVEKLVGAKSLETVIQIQTEYAKAAYAAFVAHATKMGELYSDLAKAACKPVELPFANLLGTKE